MRFAIFGDVHANLEALEAVLLDAADQGCTHHACIGDIVGYNANPSECVELVRALDCPVVMGNHDEHASRDTLLIDFNPLAEAAMRWTRAQLSEENRAWLGHLPLVRRVDDFLLVHASLDLPQTWNYVFSARDSFESMQYQTPALCFFGHTHVPRAFVQEEDGGVSSLLVDFLPIEPGKKYFINVGSVGQPRDGDWHAAYCIYDTEQQTVELRRIEYDIDTAQDKVVDAGLPQSLADRLALGS
jgi:diadenosine tetraphosphatase ApaH/serine/threonine PP2A family protein phosphatase